MGDRTVMCISVRQPWANLIAWGCKTIENREWACRYRGHLLIHAGRTWKDDERRSYNRLLQTAIDNGLRDRVDILSRAPLMLGGLVGVCRMTGCIHASDWFLNGGRRCDGIREWFVGPYGFMLDRATPFEQMVPYKGRQGMFRVPARDVPGLDGLLVG